MAVAVRVWPLVDSLVGLSFVGACVCVCVSAINGRTQADNMMRPHDNSDERGAHGFSPWPEPTACGPIVSPVMVMSIMSAPSGGPRNIVTTALDNLCMST